MCPTGQRGLTAIKEVIMEQKCTNARHTLAEVEEDKVWASFYRHSRDPDLAVELIAHMDKDAESREQHSGLYLRCKQSVRLRRASEARAARVANIIRMVCQLIVLTPVRALMYVLRKAGAMARFGSDIALNVCELAASNARPRKARGTRRSASLAKECAQPDLVDAKADQATPASEQARSA